MEKADFVLCEDTRVTKKILFRFKIKTPLLSYHQHSEIKRIEEIIDKLEKGKDLALVSDAGTPGISDPGSKLIKEVKERLSDKVKIVPVPGPSALTAAVSISGFPAERFLFLGFLPPRKIEKPFSGRFQNQNTRLSFTNLPTGF